MKLLKNKKFAMTIFLAFLFYGIVFLLLRYYGINAQKIQSIVSSFGFSGYLTIFLSQLLASFTPLPDSPIAIMAILLYGPIFGSSITYSAMLIAAVIQYFFALKMGKAYVSKHIPEAEHYIKKLHEGDNLFIKMVVIRVFSVLPVDLAAYVAGVAGIKFRIYLLSTMVGLIPIVINSIFLSQGLYADDWYEFLSIGIGYLFFITLIWIASVIVKKYKDPM